MSTHCYEQLGYIHICTYGLFESLLCKDKADFVMAVNKIAISFCLGKRRMRVVAVVVMSNHIHIVAIGSLEDAKYCAELFKKTYSMYYSNKYGKNSKILRHIRTGFTCGQHAYGQNAVGYVLNNPRHHGVANNPFIYRWSSAREYFKEDQVYQLEMPGIQAGLTCNQREKVLGTSRFKIPKEWKIDDNGMVTFDSFICTEAAENLFRNYKSYEFFVSKGTMEADEFESVYTDLEARELAIKLAEEQTELSSAKIGGEEVLIALNSKQRESVIRTMKRTYRVGDASIRRIFTRIERISYG